MAEVQNQKTSNLRFALAYLLCASIWGTTWYGIRVCIAPGGFPSFPAAALRFTFSGLILAVVWLALRSKLKIPTVQEVRWIVFAGCVSGVAYGLLYAAEESISGGLAAVVSATGPLIAALLAAATKTETVSKANIIGSVVAIAGVALVFHDRLQVAQAQAVAVGLLSIVCVLNASSNVAMKHHAHDVAPLVSNTLFFSSAALSLWIGALFKGQAPTQWSLGPTLALLYLTIFGTLIAFASFFYLLRNVRLSTAMTLAFVTPIIALVVDAFFDKNTVLTMESYIGIAIILSGVAISVFLRDRI